MFVVIVFFTISPSQMGSARVVFSLQSILFTIHIDDLLEKQGVGCFWRHHFAGAVCYADEIALIALHKCESHSTF